MARSVTMKNYVSNTNYLFIKIYYTLCGLLIRIDVMPFFKT